MTNYFLVSKTKRTEKSLPCDRLNMDWLEKRVDLPIFLLYLHCIHSCCPPKSWYKQSWVTPSLDLEKNGFIDAIPILLFIESNFISFFKLCISLI